MENLALTLALQRRFVFFDKLAALNRRGMHVADPWGIGASLGLDHEETERVLSSLEAIGWIERGWQNGAECVALTVTGLARL